MKPTRANAWATKIANRTIALLVGVALLMSGQGCASSSKDALIAPQATLAPYEAARGDVLWAVAPLRNESGTSEADVGAISDALVAAAEEVRGVRALPLNRTLEAMRALRMAAVRTPGDARQLAQAMGVDGVLVGSITAYDPYTPVLGMSLALYARPGALADRNGRKLDARALQTAATDATPIVGSVHADAPLATASELLDAKNHQVLMDLKQYAEGRSDASAPAVGGLGWKKYTASMPLYAEFAAHQTVRALLQSEWIRVSGVDWGRGEDR